MIQCLRLKKAPSPYIFVFLVLQIVAAKFMGFLIKNLEFFAVYYLIEFQ